MLHFLMVFFGQVDPFIPFFEAKKASNNKRQLMLLRKKNIS